MRGAAKFAAKAAIIALPAGGAALAAWYFWRHFRDPAGEDEKHADAGLLARLRASVFTSREAESEAIVDTTSWVQGTPAEPYAGQIASAAAKYRLAPKIIAAVGQHESRWGTADHYAPNGAGGVGDRAPRTLLSSSKIPAPLLPYWTPDVSQDAKGRSVGHLAAPNWASGGVDRAGFGLGLMQIDAYWQADWAFEIDENTGLYAWEDPATNIEKGASILRASMDAFDDDPYAALAAYNAGVGAVRRAIAAGQDPDSATGANHYLSHISDAIAVYGGTIGEPGEMPA